MSDYCVDQERLDGFALKTTALNGGENSGDKGATFFTRRSEGLFAPQDTSSEDSFGVVVGGFDTFSSKECPQCRLKLEEVSAERGGFLILHASATL